MTRPFHSAPAAAEHAIGRLLSLPATGREQDWEIELADPSRIGDMLALDWTVLTFDERCALASLLIGSFEEASLAGKADPHLLAHGRTRIADDPRVHDAMRSFWIDQGHWIGGREIDDLLGG